MQNLGSLGEHLIVLSGKMPVRMAWIKGDEIGSETRRVRSRRVSENDLDFCTWPLAQKQMGGLRKQEETERKEQVEETGMVEPRCIRGMHR